MFTKGLSSQTQSNLAALAGIPCIRTYYLAGGTAVSLHIGHRFSNDLDFFSRTPEEPMVIRNQLHAAGKVKTFQNDTGTFNGVLNGVKLSMFIYPYALLYPTHNFNEINVADIRDIACMKIDAISSRGKKRDFIDLYFICKKIIPLKDLLKLFARKYKSVDYNTVHILKSLVFFQDADRDEEPIMINKVVWDEVKSFFIREVRSIKL